MGWGDSNSQLVFKFFFTNHNVNSCPPTWIYTVNSIYVCLCKYWGELYVLVIVYFVVCSGKKIVFRLEYVGAAISVRLVTVGNTLFHHHICSISNQWLKLMSDWVFWVSFTNLFLKWVCYKIRVKGYRINNYIMLFLTLVEESTILSCYFFILTQGAIHFIFVVL